MIGILIRLTNLNHQMRYSHKVHYTLLTAKHIAIEAKISNSNDKRANPTHPAPGQALSGARRGGVGRVGPFVITIANFGFD